MGLSFFAKACITLQSMSVPGKLAFCLYTPQPAKLSWDSFLLPFLSYSSGSSVLLNSIYIYVCV